MLITKKMLLALTLVAALIGGGVGALLTRSGASAENTPVTASAPTAPVVSTQTGYETNQPAATAADQFAAANGVDLKTPEEQAAYRQGFNDGFLAARETKTSAYAPATVSYREPYRHYYSRRVYYDYNHHGRTFWQKHRDKLTLAIGTGSGALIGGLIGGGKGAGIGALAGLGGSALYTYKLRHR